MPRKVKDIAGQVFGRATAIAIDHVGRQGAIWQCRCACGSVFKANGKDLRNGNTNSCGCYMRDRTREASITHGATSGGEFAGAYRSWRSMKQRCNDPNWPRYHDYGGRGIGYSERWEKFENFLSDMGDRPAGQAEAARRLGTHPANLVLWRRKPSAMPPAFASRLQTLTTL